MSHLASTRSFHVVLAILAFAAIATFIGVPALQAGDPPPKTTTAEKDKKTMDGTEQKGSNVGRNDKTKPTAPNTKK